MKWPLHLMTLDFETFWSKDFTLKKLTTEAYVRSPQFKVHGAAVKYNECPAEWVDGPDLAEFFANIPWSDVALLAQHAQFDGLILSHHFGHVPALWLDTLSMARLALPRARSHSLAGLSAMAGLPPKGKGVDNSCGKRDLTPDELAELGATSCGDADNTYDVFRWLLDFVPDAEIPVIDATMRLFTEPRLTLDREAAVKLLGDVRKNKTDLLAAAGVTREQCASSGQFAALLEDMGVDVVRKLGKPKKSGEQSLLPAVAKNDVFMKDLAAHEDPLVRAMAAARLGVASTLEETRLESLIAMHDRGPLCVYLKHAGAHTLRWSGGDKVNFQNFPREGSLRRCIRAPEGHKIVVVDLSQIEARMLNTLAGQWDVCELFANGDPYSVLASRFYGRPVNKKEHPKDRQVGKVGELGLGYQMGAPKLRWTLSVGALGGEPVFIDLDTAKAWVGAYRSSHAKVEAYWAEAEIALQHLHARARNQPWGPMVLDDGLIWLPNGTYLDYRGLQRIEGRWYLPSRYGGLTAIYGGKLVENVVQALSRVVIAEAMPDIAARYPIVMTTHDEIATCVLDTHANEVYRYMLERMTVRPWWLPAIPLAAEGGFDDCYSK